MGTRCAVIAGMGEVDRKKHDVDVLERVLGGVGESTPPAHSTPLFDVDVPWFGGSMRSTVEMTVGLPEESRAKRRNNG
jgi:hypothetical protein